MQRLAIAICAALLGISAATLADDLDAPVAPKQASAPDPRAELGRKLFFDPLLSSDRTVSCASCHKPEHAFADALRLSQGVGGQLGARNTPSVMNSTARVSFFWDGRAATLEQQAIFPIENPVEMNLPIAVALERINADADYATAFAKLYGGPATAKSLGRALAVFQKTLETANSPYDRFNRGDDDAISASAKRGRLLFIGKGNCATCHSGEDFTSDRFENIGLFNARELNDRGRADFTKVDTDAGMFKVPSLRNVAMTAPYMHNGMFATLRDVIDYYNEPDKHVKGALRRDAKLDKPLALAQNDIADLEAFLLALTDDRFAAAQNSSSPAARQE
jgi:cytochrome c peroxidase